MKALTNRKPERRYEPVELLDRELDTWTPAEAEALAHRITGNWLAHGIESAGELIRDLTAKR